eukprot:COSAG02_NODE_3951_length_5993_cov_4.177978_1_plen_111_part_00
MLPKRAVVRQGSPCPTDHLDIFQPSTSGSVDATARNSRIGLAPRQKIPVLVPLHSQMHSWATLNDVSSPACDGEYEDTVSGAHDVCMETIAAARRLVAFGHCGRRAHRHR